MGYYEDDFENNNDYLEQYDKDIEQLKQELYRTEQALDDWDLLSRDIVDLESAYEYDNIKSLETVDRMCEICSKEDVYLRNLWETKASIINIIKENSREFPDIFEEQDRHIRQELNDKINELHRELREI